jgi:hypothetical protein
MAEQASLDRECDEQARAAAAVSAFANGVYESCKKVPAGFVTTYGDIARVLHTSPRAVGNALGRNPFAPKVIIFWKPHFVLFVKYSDGGEFIYLYLLLFQFGFFLAIFFRIFIGALILFQINSGTVPSCHQDR